MKKTLKFALLGAAVGAGYVAAKSAGSDGAPTAEGETSTATVVGGLTITGAAVGFMLDRRSRRKHRKRSAMEALKAGDLVLAAKAARPLIESAMEAARPKVEHAIDVARPKLEHAAEATRDAAASAAVKARPKVEHAFEVARDAATPRIEHAREVTLAKMDDGVKKAKDKAKKAELNGHRAVLIHV